MIKDPVLKAAVKEFIAARPPRLSRFLIIESGTLGCLITR
jgi:hypothetical protein